MKFTKMHGIGNDFVLVDARDLTQRWPELAKEVCDRHFGAGADGLILVLTSDDADLGMRMFNPDGSESDMCGNGLRCFIKYAVDRKLVDLSDEIITVETGAGILSGQPLRRDGHLDTVRVQMGRPRFAPNEVPVAIEAEPPLKDIPLEIDGETIAVTCLSMGNPHAVHFIDGPVDAYPLETVGPKVEHHPLFPHRVNFEVARVVARDHIEARVWERGAGPTLACGSGAAAVMVAARLHDLADQWVELRLPGGTLALEWDGEGEVFITGPAVEVYEGEWP